MTEETIRAFVRRAIEDIAPDADLDALDPRASLREELDLDSMDFLALVRAIHAALGVAIPETDYAKIDSLDGCVAYVLRALAAPA
ncbi:MAG: acyl carrier protein [Sandaracinaceae bacterium]|nr:acyl carrier protein [Sandaracinaceae bacterium]